MTENLKRSFLSRGDFRETFQRAWQGERTVSCVHPMPSVMNILTVAKLWITEATLNDEKFVTGKTIELGKDNFQSPPLCMPPQCRNEISWIPSFSRKSCLHDIRLIPLNPACGAIMTVPTRQGAGKRLLDARHIEQNKAKQ